MKKEARQDLQIWSAIAMLAFGCSLTVAGFIVPPLGVISDSVLLVLAQCFIYAGSALGIDYYVNMKLKERPPGPLSGSPRGGERTGGGTPLNT